MNAVHPVAVAIFSIGFSTLMSAAPSTWGDWPSWDDQRDGTYRNPVLPGDYSDLDCTRVGLFTYNNRGEQGHVDVDRFTYTYANPTGSARVPASGIAPR